MIKKIDCHEREGSLARALATPITMRDASGRTTPGRWWIHPRRPEIQQLYADAFEAVPPTLEGRVLKGYVAYYPALAWDPNSWFMELWWELRARRDPHAKHLLKAIAAGIQAPADLGMPKNLARRKRLAQARSALDNYWLPHCEGLRTLLRHYRDTQKWSRPVHRDLAARAAKLRKQFVARFVALTGYSPTPTELAKAPLSRLLRRAASKAYGVSERLLHSRPRTPVVGH